MTVKQDIFINMSPWTKAGGERKDYYNERRRFVTSYKKQSYYKPGRIIRKVEIRFYVKDINRKIDLDNMIKEILDALTGIAYKDDSQIEEIHAYKLDTLQGKEGIQLKLS